MPITQAMYRDRIRDKLGIQPPSYWPPSDPRHGPVGAQPDYAPVPSNASLNNLIGDAIAKINRETGFESVPDIPIAVAAQTENGAYLINLQSANENEGVPQGSIMQVRRAYWDDLTGTTYLLQPTNYAALDRNRWNWQAEPVSLPQWYWQEGYQLYLFPSPSTAGELHILAGTGLYRLRTDEDFLDQLPDAFQVVVEYTAVVLYAPTDPENKAAAASAAVFAPLMQQGMNDIGRWRVNLIAPVQGDLALGGYRRFTRAGRW